MKCRIEGESDLAPAKRMGTRKVVVKGRQDLYQVVFLPELCDCSRGS